MQQPPQLKVKSGRIDTSVVGCSISSSTVFMFLISYSIVLKYPSTRWRVFKIKTKEIYYKMMIISFWRIIVVQIKSNDYLLNNKKYIVYVAYTK